MFLFLQNKSAFGTPGNQIDRRAGVYYFQAAHLVSALAVNA